jgi:hypothetical protein
MESPLRLGLDRRLRVRPAREPGRERASESSWLAPLRVRSGRRVEA